MGYNVLPVIKYRPLFFLYFVANSGCKVHLYVIAGWWSGGFPKAPGILQYSIVRNRYGNRQKIKLASENKSQKIKKIRNPVRQNVDQALLRWFEIRRSENTAISPVIKAKAEDLSRGLQGDDFKCSTGWLERFKIRHNINFSKVSGEAGDVDRQVVLKWLDDKWPGTSKNCSRMIPDRTLKFREEKCVGGKQSKLRYTVWVCANMTGSEKCKLLVIGKYERPMCMKNVKSLPVIYKSNTRAWMTSVIFENYLKDWDKNLRRQNREILLQVDNCAAHSKTLHLTNIRFEFLPPNYTSVVQPMDQGIIKCFKAYYRRSSMCRLIKSLDNKEPFNITILDSIKLIDQSYDELPLAQWFEKYKNTDMDCNDWDVPLSNWLRLNYEDLTSAETYLAEYDGFSTVDDNVIATETLTDDGITAEVLGTLNDYQNSDNENDDAQQDGEKPTSHSEALCAIKSVIHFLETINNVSDDILQAALKVERHIENIKLLKSNRWPSFRDNDPNIVFFFNMDLDKSSADATSELPATTEPRRKESLYMPSKILNTKTHGDKPWAYPG
ncbi:tigger transposable element-derived protein 4-like [Euwallacea similis]|uniref:tigger transposable element-derived protein 4-like n=1 Tax=Euwallacea similis TaxID=1736056 RepID=UPI00344E050A